MTDKEVRAEAFRRACLITKDRKWKKGDFFCHPDEDVTLQIDRLVTGKAGEYAVAEMFEPGAPVAIPTGKFKRFLLSEITDPFLAYTCGNVAYLQEIGRSDAIVPLVV